MRIIPPLKVIPMSKTTTSLAALAFSTSALWGQSLPTYSFSLSEESDQGVGVDASGTVALDAENSTISVDLFNGDANPSVITKFYILKPEDTDGNRLDLDELVSEPNSEWEGVDELDSSTMNGRYKPEGSKKDFYPLYFGAEAGPNSGLSEHDSAEFSFAMEGAGSDWDFESYFAESVPHFFIRWQSVGENGNYSAKGYGSFGGSITPVPEPAEIGLAGFLGLGGLLYVRRRWKNRKAAVDS